MVRKGFRDVQKEAFVFTELFLRQCNFAWKSLTIYHFYIENAQTPFLS